jgi:hypothetical protein
MQRTLRLTPHPAPAFAAVAARCAAWLRHAWVESTLDEEERFLRGAHDLADLERRLQRLQRGRVERFGPLHRDA